MSLSSHSLSESATLPILEHIPSHEIERRLRAGQRCVLARAGDQVVAYCWLGIRRWRLPNIGIDVALPTGEAYLYDAYTVPAYRGQRIFGTVLNGSIEEARRTGCHRIHTCVDRNNMSSLAGVDRVGFEESIELTSIRLLGIVSLYIGRGRNRSASFIGLLASRSTRMDRGLFVWRAGGTGIRVNLRHHIRRAGRTELLVPS